jgi:hypothetical protein
MSISILVGSPARKTGPEREAGRIGRSGAAAWGWERAASSKLAMARPLPPSSGRAIAFWTTPMGVAKTRAASPVGTTACTNPITLLLLESTIGAPPQPRRSLSRSRSISIFLSVAETIVP